MSISQQRYLQQKTSLPSGKRQHRWRADGESFDTSSRDDGRSRSLPGSEDQNVPSNHVRQELRRKRTVALGIRSEPKQKLAGEATNGDEFVDFMPIRGVGTPPTDCESAPSLQRQPRQRLKNKAVDRAAFVSAIGLTPEPYFRHHVINSSSFSSSSIRRTSGGFFVVSL
jgi:hypothetical protein